MVTWQVNVVAWNKKPDVFAVKYGQNITITVNGQIYKIGGRENGVIVVYDVQSMLGSCFLQPNVQVPLGGPIFTLERIPSTESVPLTARTSRMERSSSERSMTLGRPLSAFEY